MFQRHYSPIPRIVANIFTSPLHETPSKSVSSDNESNYPYSFLSSVDIGLMMILTMMIIPTILIIILTVLPIMLLVVPSIIDTHKEQDLFPNMNTVRPTTVSVLLTISSEASPSSTSPHKSSKRKELCLQQQQFWAFIQKLHYSCIGSSCSGFKWITAILYKLSMTIWTLWQFHNDGVCLSTSAWQLLIGVLQ